VLAHAQQDAVWAHQQIGNQIRDLLNDFYPAALAAFVELPEGGLARADARTVLAAVGPIWALGSLRASPGARRHCNARSAAGDWNHQAQRHLFIKFLGQLHHRLQAG
jgi:hypothetical protein